MAEILATVDDINANLPSEDFDGSGVVVMATEDNTTLLQLSVARVVRGYLSGVIDNATLVGWVDPDSTPEIVTEAAAKMIAAQLYMQRVTRTTALIDARHYAQVLYDQAMAILNGIKDGSIIIGEEVVVVGDSLAITDFHPIDDTDRAFGMGLEL
jgi:hypothetical protein